MKNVLKLLSIPLVLLVVYLSMAAIWTLADLPTGDTLLAAIRDYFSRYGLWLVFFGALIEGFLLLGQYFPGGFIIFLGVISAGKDIPRAVETVAVVSAAFFISYALNYLVGKYGWHALFVKFGLKQALENAKAKLERQGLSAVILSYWEPNLASITATAAGVLQMSPRKFLLFSGIGIIVWNIFWGVLVFNLGEAALKLAGFKYVIAIFLIWAGIILAKYYFFDRKKALSQS